MWRARGHAIVTAPVVLLRAVPEAFCCARWSLLIHLDCSFGLGRISVRYFYAEQYNNTALGFLCEMEEKVRARGRPRAYDPEKALDKAIEVFWANGYAGASLDELSVAMGMGRPSIYNAFGDKDALFLKALGRYRETIGSTPLLAMAGVDSVKDALNAFYEGVVEYTTCDKSHPGCLMGSVAINSNQDEVRGFLTESLDWIQEQLEARLASAVASGQLPTDYPVALGARRAVNLMITMTVRARLTCNREELLNDAHAATAAVLEAHLPDAG
jgi:AcrR family transcriptional regulator